MNSWQKDDITICSSVTLIRLDYKTAVFAVLLHSIAQTWLYAVVELCAGIVSAQ